MAKRKQRRPIEFDRASRVVPRDRFPDGRVRFSLGAAGREGQARRTEITKVWVWRAWDVLQGLAAGDLDPGNVAAAVKAEGEAALGKLRREAAAKAAGGIPTVREMAERYLAHYDRGRREEHSVKQIRSRLLGHRPGRGFCQRPLTPEEAAPGEDGTPVPVGMLPFPTLTGPITERVIEDGWEASATREAIRLAVSGLYTWAIDEEARAARDAGRAPRWSINPAAEVESYERRPRHATASEAQVLALLQNAELHQLAYLRVFLHLGLREDELIHTRLHLDLDMETWLWRIQGRGPDERHGCIQCQKRGWTPKAARSWRVLLVPTSPAPLRAALRDYWESYPCEAGDFLFRNPRTGRPWDAGRLRADFRALCRRAEVTYGRKTPGGITLHDLRATCATRLVQAKERESVIAALLGDTVQTIVKTYVRLTERDTADAVSRGPRYEIGESNG